MARDIQKFDVGLKAFIEREGKLLVVRESNGGKWEVPGGRIDVGEEELAMHDILRREIDEELGKDFQLTMGEPFTSWIRPWTPPKTGLVYLTGYRCSYVSGEIIISHEHTETRWIAKTDIDMIEWAPGYKEAAQKFWQ
jgi:8-oxo-dGTP pyrophosphatase MutT (NUDIX family)